MTLYGPPGRTAPKMEINLRTVGSTGAYTPTVVTGTLDEKRNCYVYNWNASATKLTGSSTSVVPDTGTAQYDYQFPLDLLPGTVGQPYTVFDDLSIDPGLFEGITITLTASGNVPPGMQVAPFFRYYGTLTTAGEYRFDLILTYSVPEVSLRIVYNCTQTILPAAGQPVMLDPPSQTISATINGGAQNRSLVLSNRSAQAKTFTATASTSSSRNWLTVGGGGSLGPFSSSSLSISADPQGLGVGTYTGTISIAISPTNERLSAVVLFTVTGSQQNLALSQSGLTFQAAQGGVSPPALPFSVFNESAGTLAWTATASTLPTSPGCGSCTPRRSAAEPELAPSPPRLQGGQQRPGERPPVARAAAETRPARPRLFRPRPGPPASSPRLQPIRALRTDG